MRKLLIALALFLFPAISFAQITWTIPTTVTQANANKIGVVQGPVNNYGNSQILRDQTFTTGGSMPTGDYTFSLSCYSGGTNDTTHWYNPGSSSSNPFVANILNTGGTATYVAYNQSNGAILGSGTITANTSNSSGGMTLTLSNAMTRACIVGGFQPQSSDAIFVRFKANAGVFSPNQTDGNVSTSVTYETTDLPGSVPFTQAYSIPAGSTSTYYLDPNWTYQTDPAGGHSIIAQNFNGNYTFTYWEKCVVAGCSIPYSIKRNNTPLAGNASGTDTPSGTSWVQVTRTVAATETGTQQVYPVTVNFGANTQAAYVGGIHFTAAANYSGNTTAFTDAYYKKLVQEQLSDIRVMYPAMWGIQLADYILPDSQIPFANSGNSYGNGAGAFTLQPVYSMQDDLGLCLAYKASVSSFSGCWITLPKVLTASDASTLHTFLTEGCNLSGCSGTTSQSWLSMLSAAGVTMYFELGNEAWNYGAGLNEYNGLGFVYGAIMGPFVTAFKTNGSYNSTYEKLIENQQLQQSGSGSYFANVMTQQGCTTSAPNNCPDYADSAFYRMTYWNDPTSNTIFSGGNGEINFWQTRSSGFGYPIACGNPDVDKSYYWSAHYNALCYNIGSAMYESATNVQSGGQSGAHFVVTESGGAVTSICTNCTNGNEGSGYSSFYPPTITFSGGGCTTTPTATPIVSVPGFITGGTVTGGGAGCTSAPTATVVNNPSTALIPTQLQNNQQEDSVGGAIISVAGLLSMQKEAGYTGPLNIFAETDFGTSSGTVNNGANNIYYNAWNAVSALPDGPGQVNSQDTSIDLPVNLMIRMVNTAIGSNNNLLADTTSSIPVTASYAGDTNDTVPAQSNLPLVRCQAYANTGQTAVTGVCTNFDPSNSYTVAMTGALAPAGGTTVTQTAMGGSSSALQANNNTDWFGSGNSPGVTYPTSTTSTGPNVNLTPGSINTFTYTLSGTPPAATPTFSPAAGSYGPTQNVTISDTTPSSSIYYCTTGPCTSGGTLVSGTVSVPSSTTLYAYATASGYTQSSTSSAAYTITGGGTSGTNFNAKIGGGAIIK